ncbi:acetyltransferase [Hymenobacter negativus]|uniref:Acetyltransferase n=1 Tax=Hymenobacter negativus TaxID=2795026 RepID=A0ABS0Q4P4_9BACT|nr:MULTISPECIES: acetyltransferase [Bacteria]MBH8557632.1 acetyltransferase [Hymenobacter negativus]MBH8567838.1 acetyltransferase [Hymenobacter negativus]MBR7207574.1 acetyltransferase [Microvirga sp. STS02]
MNKPVLTPGATVRVAIIGAGSLGQQIAQHLQQTAGWAVAGFFDDFAAPATVTPHGPVLGRVDAIEAAYAGDAFDAMLMGIGYHHLAVRQQLFERLVARVPFATFVHPASYLDSSAVVEPGCFVSPGCILDLNVHLGPNTFLYPGCVLAHDTTVVGHSFLAPSVRLAGHVTVQPRCFLGIGTTVIDSLELGEDVRTGGGATVVHNLTGPGTYVGTPAKKILSSGK